MSFSRKVSDNYGEKLFNTATKAGPDAEKTASKKVAYKTAKATGELIGNKIAKKIVKPKLVPDLNSRNVEVIVILLEKRQEILKNLR